MISNRRTVSTLTPEMITNGIPSRHIHGSKYDHGVVVALTGSRGMTGAATLAASGALRSGCGMYYALVPASSMTVMAIKNTEPVLIECAETETGSFALDNNGVIETALEKARVVLVGSGCNRHPETLELIRETVLSCDLPVVLDGDGLFAFSENPQLLKMVHSLVITPHYGELKRLFGEFSTDESELISKLRQVAVEYQMVIVFKGMPTYIATPEGTVFYSEFGNSGMATAGSGDVLAGIIASLIAQGASLNDAVITGVGLHGSAGDLAAQELTEYGMIASDIVSYLPKAIGMYKRAD